MLFCRYLVNVPLTITVLDENDNEPRFSIPEYVSYIKEGNTIPDPAIQVKVCTGFTETEDK